MKKGTMKKWLTVLASLILAISLFAIPVFADEPNAQGATAKKLETDEIVAIIIGAVLVLVAVVLCIKFREKLGKFFKVLKSESKKIVWLSWPQTLKNSLVVGVVLVVCAIVICLLDIGLSKGFTEFIELFQKKP